MPSLHRLGWVLFIVSSVFFTWSGYRARDWVAVAGSVVFGLACILFLLPDRE